MQCAGRTAADPDGDGVANEICNRLDDDCDGKIDEGNPEGGADCPMGNPGICSGGVRTCQEDGVLRCVAEYEPATYKSSAMAMMTTAMGLPMNPVMVKPTTQKRVSRARPVKWANVRWNNPMHRIVTCLRITIHRLKFAMVK